MTLSTEATSAHAVAAAIDVIPSGAALGAEVKGVDLRNLEDTAFACVLQAWHDHSVLLVRGQTLSDQELVAFRAFSHLTESFGIPESAGF